MMWLAAETTDNEEFKGREEAAEQECEAEREPVEKRGKTTEQEDKEGSSTVTGREGATGRAAAEEGAKAAEKIDEPTNNQHTIAPVFAVKKTDS